MDNLISNPNIFLRKLFPSFIGDLYRPFYSPAEPKSFRKLHRHVAPRILEIVLLQRLYQIAYQFPQLRKLNQTRKTEIFYQIKEDIKSSTGEFLVHELKSLLLVAETLAIVVVAASEVMPERLLVEIRIQRARSGAVLWGATAADRDDLPAAWSRSHFGGGSDSGREASELRGDRRHRISRRSSATKSHNPEM